MQTHSKPHSTLIFSLKSDQILGCVLILLVMGAFAILAFMHPSPSGLASHTQLGLPPCPIHHIFGIKCPGCGMTTALIHLVHGHLGSALASHLASPLVFLGLIMSFFAGIQLARARTTLDRIFLSSKMLFVLHFALIFFLMTWIVNLTKG